MANNPNDNVVTKADVIRNLLRELPKDATSNSVLAMILDDALQRAGFESNLNETYHQALKNDNSWGKSLHHHLNDVPQVVVDELRHYEEESYKLLLKKIEADFARHHKGYATTSHLLTTAAISSLGLSAGKAVTANILPPALETMVISYETEETKKQAINDFESGKITLQQLEIIKQHQIEIISTVGAASMAPDPSGIISDKARAAMDEQLRKALMTTGMPEAVSQQYELGSLNHFLEQLSQKAVDSASNQRDVQQEMTASGKVPLHMALGIPANKLSELAAMTEKLGEQALKAEVFRNADFRPLAILPPADITKLGNLISANKLPNVAVNDEGSIKMLPNQHTLPPLYNQPALAADDQQAFIQAAQHIISSKNPKIEVSENRSDQLKTAINIFAKAYTNLDANGGISSNDIAALSMSAAKIALTLETYDQTKSMEN